MPTFRRGVRSLRRWRIWHAVVAAFALLTFFGDVYQTAHLLLTAHVRCPLDGALVHEDEIPLGERALDDMPSRRGPRPESAVPIHDHGDCATRGVLHRFAAIVVPVRCPAGCMQACDIVALDGAESAVARSVLSYAPKLSPPA
ncbi:MAG TPA: hypothetical protein VGC79_31755 [Polyangiaceae bacterium]